jgi:hypothetical protein
MAMIYMAREIAKDGKGTGRFRYVGMSDEERGVVDECCQCENGHATPDEATDCPEAKAHADKIFGRDLDSLQHRVDHLSQELGHAQTDLFVKKLELEKEGPH